jgi:hypothetical protein
MIPIADSANLLLSSWQNFYVMVGSCAGALIGLQFVVITLVAGTRQRASMETVNAFGSPIVVQFGAAMAISGIMVAPWGSVHSISIALALCGVAGLIYSTIVLQRARHQTGYKPVLEDWVWYVTAPFITYAVLAIAAALVWADTATGLFIGAGATLSLLLIGSRNAWDTVTHLASGEHRPNHDTNDPQSGESKSDDH